MYQCQAAAGHAALLTLFNRLARFLALAIMPLFVFDGPNRPAFKKRMAPPNRHLSMQKQFKQLIDAFGFKWTDVCQLFSCMNNCRNDFAGPRRGRSRTCLSVSFRTDSSSSYR